MSTFRTLPIVAFATLISLTGCQTMSLHQNEGTTNDSTNHSAEAVKQINNNDLAAYHWQLVKATDNQKRPIESLNKIKQQVTLSFDKKQNGYGIWFSVGCNSMGAGYTLQSNTMQVGQIISTMMLCQDLDAAEKQLASLMDGRSQLSLKAAENPILTQTTENGSTIVWQGAKTPEARYGQQAGTVFWQIDHQLQQCPNPDAGSTCLKAREVFYDDKGIKTGFGPWQLIVDPIEGYQHDTGLDQVVRIKRFVVDPADVKGKQSVYVFDRIVESSVVE
ncbi:META domain-containing protein [Psychrobacter sp. FDAARGOS_221]|uniref:META domain-containing protein n=1 Tax=Psychrobacter sp. FDAARGOS_221 TaxID=1975705 RepID=UPI000BB530D6|nr:META domain-containing protein [Psychrobacter sp. FDAARGOS_221]PNK59752.1 META domain-containing protein [Psychrobacter sp. FDAARGOS_221]